MALLSFAIGGLYTVASGFHGVVWTDLIQAILILVLVLYVAVKVMVIAIPSIWRRMPCLGG